MGKVTIKDVAKEAGVSIATVSNALNDVDVLNPDTKQRVMEAVDKLQYVPNLTGRYLKVKESKMIGFFTGNISGPYFSTLIDAMSRQCEIRGYGMSIFVTHDKSKIMANILGKMIDGAIIFQENVIREEDITRLEAADIGVVFLDRELSHRRMSSVVFDSYRDGFEATRHLISLGYKRIAFIQSEEGVLESEQRKSGYIAAMREFQLEVDKELILQGKFSEEVTYQTVSRFIEKHSDGMPEAFLAGNDSSAIGCIKALHAAGYRVPEDVGVMGFDDIDIAAYFNPPLTTVRTPSSEQGLLAVDTLLDMISDKEEGCIKRLGGDVVIRESCRVKRE